MKQASPSEDWIPASTAEWSDWVAEQEARTLRVYKEDPDRLIADYRRERQISRGYQGREILELLQNANDAAAEGNVRGKVRIELSTEGLIVANTGRPFTTGGVNSLRITDLSPKLRRKTHLIGQKGLGFRAVLNWSRQPYIESGYLRLVFSDGKLRSICHDLEGSNPQIATLLAAEKGNSEDVILPSLPFPMVIDDKIDFRQGLPAHHRKIMDRCDFLRGEFDTVIGMPFNDASILDLAKGELQELRPEILLFAENLGSISMTSPNVPEETWEISGNSILELNIKGSSNSTRRYEIFRDHNSIPAELISELTASEYDIILAVPQDGTPRDLQTLFSFFPTNVRFPFPVVCHATMELDSNRKYPTEGQPNYFLFGKIAELLARVAESQDSESNPWFRAEIVARQQSYDTPLERVNFGKRLLQHLQEKKIIPVIHGDYREPAKCVRLVAENLDWLPVQGFGDICLPGLSNPVRQLLDEIGIETLPSTSLCRRLNEVTFQSVEQRIEVVTGLITENLTPKDPAPNLLIDKTGRIIPSNERIYFSPDKEQKIYNKPDWLKLHFLNEPFRQELAEKLNVSDRRELRQKLEPYGVQEYSLANVASAIAVDTRKQMDSDPTRSANYQQDMVIALFDLFPSEGDIAKLPETTAVPLLTIAGSYSDSRQLYFSKEYAGNGRLLASLYEYRPDLLVAPLHALGLDGQSTHTIAFLQWLGVASWPRVVITDNVETKFVQYVLDNVTYPMKSERYLRTSRSEFYRPFLKTVKSIDGLTDILRSHPAGIITWFALDGRANSWSFPASDNGELWDDPKGAKYVYRFSTLLPSYVKWKVQHTAWVPTVNNELVEPRRCMLGERGLEKLLPPPVDFRHELFDIYGINTRLKRNALENAGVTPDISHLDPEQIYEMIARMPNVDPTGKHARIFYRTLLERVDTDMRLWPEVSQTFIESAMMWGLGPDGAKYYPIRDLLHADSEDFPEQLCTHLTLVDLPKRVGSLKVRRLFGIEPVDRRKIIQKIRRVVEHPETQDIQVQFHRIKPYLFYLRNVRSKQTSELNTLQKLQVVLCSTVEVDIEYDDVKVSSAFERHLEWTLDGETAYILYADVKRPSLDSDLLTDALGAILASIFNLAQGSDFARLIRCAEYEREDLLKRIVGETEIPGFLEIAAQFDQTIKGYTMVIMGGGGEMPGPVTSEGLGPKTEVGTSKDKAITDPGTGEITPTKTDHEPTAVGEKRDVVVRRFTGKHPGGPRKGLKRVVDPNVCENRAMQFEQLDSHFPVRVSNVTGYDGPRCDILSFATEGDCATFMAQTNSKKRDLSLVLKFIEVKGRSHENTPISLKGNELDAAKTFGEKYFLYRFYLESSTKYVLLILQNPLNHPEAVEDVKDVYVDRAEAERYELSVTTELVDGNKGSE